MTYEVLSGPRKGRLVILVKRNGNTSFVRFADGEEAPFWIRTSVLRLVGQA